MSKYNDDILNHYGIEKTAAAKLFFYENFGETLEFAEDLGWEEPDEDDEDPDELEEEALQYISRKGYLIVNEDGRPDNKVIKALERADKRTVKQLREWYKNLHRPGPAAKAYMQIVEFKFSKKAGGYDDLMEILGNDQIRTLTLLRRNLMGATEASTETAKLLSKCISEMAKRVKLDSNTKTALNKMRNLNDKMRPDMARNQIFKIADLLKIKLPSGNF